MARKPTKAAIKADLHDQLARQNRDTDYNKDLIDDYMNYYKMKNDLKKDIENNGVRIVVQTGNGYSKTIFNESIKEIQKVTSTMLKILSELNLQNPILEDVTEDDYL